MLNQQRRWLRLLAWLRREFPAQKPVAVRSVKMNKDMCGEASYDGSVFRILINNDKPVEVMVETAVHEWAHVLTWFGAGHEEEVRHDVVKLNGPLFFPLALLERQPHSHAHPENLGRFEPLLVVVEKVTIVECL